VQIKRQIQGFRKLNGIDHRNGNWIVSTDLQSIDIDLTLAKITLLQG